MVRKIIVLMVNYNNFKPFVSNTFFLYPLWFSDVFRRYRKGALGILYNFNFEIHSFIS